MRAAFAVPHGLAGLHLPGMRLDLFFEDMILKAQSFVGGVLRNDQSAPPPFSFSPNQKKRTCRGRNKRGAGSYCFLGGGVTRGGAAQAAGYRFSESETPTALPVSKNSSPFGQASARRRRRP